VEPSPEVGGYINTRKKRSDEKVKFIWHWEFKWEELVKGYDVAEKVYKAMRENPDQFPKMLTNTCFTGREKGFRLIEAENEEQLMNLVLAFSPTEKWKLEPYLEFGETMAKLWEKWVGRVVE
jgi:hypothetical protein